jgi:hypothetical protein
LLGVDEGAKGNDGRGGRDAMEGLEVEVDDDADDEGGAG